MKSTILLTTALFLSSAPSLDSTTISELSAGFLVQTTGPGLMASDSAPGTSTDTTAAVRITAPWVQAKDRMTKPGHGLASAEQEHILAD